jgi:hypothetical protein
MRALILRRVGLLETGAGGPVIVGRFENGDVLRLQGFLRSNGHPYQRLDPETDPHAKALIERFQVDPGQLPIVLCPRGQLPRNPGETELARRIGLGGPIDPNRSMTQRSLAPARRALRPPSMPDRKVSARLFSTAVRSAVKLVPRLGSRTIWDFRPASPAWL